MRLTGRGVSPGVAVGRALVLTHRAHDVRYRVAAEEVDRQVERLVRATDLARRQLGEIREQLGRGDDPEPASIFDAQLLMLDDPMLTGRASDLIRGERINAEWALRRAADDLIAAFDRAADAYLRERKADIADVAGRLRLNLRDAGPQPLSGRLASLRGPVILVADELSASVAAQVDWAEVVGFVSDAGSWTYHTAILARSLHVPAVVGLNGATRLVPPGSRLAIDGTSGDVRVDPSDEELVALDAPRLSRPSAAVVEFQNLPAVTPDGVSVTLEVNIEVADEVAGARANGAQGIGLCRSEFLLGAAPGSAAESVQYDAYRGVLEAMAPLPVTIRTFDAVDDDREPRGRAGLRGLRLSLARREPFVVQLRALLRASRHGRLRILLPFVTGLDELREARRLIAEIAADLVSVGEAPQPVPVGAMIEVPAAAVAADVLGAEADFLAVGTNDLVQFALAVDRADERVSHLYNPLHPAILRLVRSAVRGARRQSRPLSVCGEMAADPALAVLLVGLGVTELSMRAGAIPLVTQVLRATPAADARRLAARALRASTAEDVESGLAAELTDERRA
ncbi:MAG TPA: phosphoenolpyruvate--protein phosphotransferase [Vicinamibacterales bacterium]|jgi:phosphotransferase system enzyme I (PtsI)|nr:phosphoenolpyruvate--protein phosphotransferase [Vicinamibacterales bacterium]